MGGRQSIWEREGALWAPFRSQIEKVNQVIYIRAILKSSHSDGLSVNKTTTRLGRPKLSPRSILFSLSLSLSLSYI